MLLEIGLWTKAREVLAWIRRMGEDIPGHVNNTHKALWSSFGQYICGLENEMWNQVLRFKKFTLRCYETSSQEMLRKQSYQTVWSSGENSRLWLMFVIQEHTDGILCECLDEIWRKIVDREGGDHCSLGPPQYVSFSKRRGDPNGDKEGRVRQSKQTTEQEKRIVWNPSD